MALDLLVARPPHLTHSRRPHPTSCYTNTFPFAFFNSLSHPARRSSTLFLSWVIAQAEPNTLARNSMFSLSQHSLTRYVFSTLARRLMALIQNHIAGNHSNVAIPTNPVYLYYTIYCGPPVARCVDWAQGYPQRGAAITGHFPPRRFLARCQYFGSHILFQF
jgi:hypothetical protein